MMTPEERMESGKLYDCTDERLQAQQRALNELVYDYNMTRPSQQEQRQELLRKIFADMGEGCYIEPPLRANWGSHTHLGNFVYANFNLTLVDDTHVYIGDHVMFGPNVTISAAGHPIEPELREKGFQYNFPIRIEDNVWVGAGAVILPGVTIGKNRHRRGQRGDEGHPGGRGGPGRALPGAAGDRRSRPGILLSGVPH